MTAEARYEGLQSVSATPLWKGCKVGTAEVTFAYGEGEDRIVRVFIVSAETFNVIRACLHRDLAMKVEITDASQPLPSKGATYSLFADIVGALFGADKANTMHREFAIWSDNLDKIIDTRVKAHATPDRVIVVDDGQVRNPEVEKMVAQSIANNTRLACFHTGGLVNPGEDVPCVVKGQAKPDIAPNTMREFLVDFISHSTRVREALELRLEKGKRDDATALVESVEQIGAEEGIWNHEIYTHSEMVIAAHRLLKVIP